MKRALMIMAAMAAISTSALADQALAQAKNCMTCHAVDKKVLGPSYKDVAAKFAKDPKAAQMLETSILKGVTSPKWGGIPMPANSQVTEAEAKKLVAWILSLK